MINNAVIPYANSIQPDLLIIQAGADMLNGDPQSRISLSNNAYWKAIKDILLLCENVIILGGGGYNPYLTAKAWAGNWVLLNDRSDLLNSDMTDECSNLLASLKWNNSRVRSGIPSKWLRSWRDQNVKTTVGDEVIWLVKKVLRMKSL